MIDEASRASIWATVYQNAKGIWTNRPTRPKAPHLVAALNTISEQALIISQQAALIDDLRTKLAACAQPPTRFGMNLEGPGWFWDMDSFRWTDLADQNLFAIRNPVTAEQRPARRDPNGRVLEPCAAQLPWFWSPEDRGVRFEARVTPASINPEGSGWSLLYRVAEGVVTTIEGDTEVCQFTIPLEPQSFEALTTRPIAAGTTVSIRRVGDTSVETFTSGYRQQFAGYFPRPLDFLQINGDTNPQPAWEQRRQFGCTYETALSLCGPETPAYFMSKWLEDDTTYRKIAQVTKAQGVPFSFVELANEIWNWSVGFYGPTLCRAYGLIERLGFDDRLMEFDRSWYPDASTLHLTSVDRPKGSFFYQPFGARGEHVMQALVDTKAGADLNDATLFRDLGQPTDQDGLDWYVDRLGFMCDEMAAEDLAVVPVMNCVINAGTEYLTALRGSSLIGRLPRRGFSVYLGNRWYNGIELGNVADETFPADLHKLVTASYPDIEQIKVCALKWLQWDGHAMLPLITYHTAAWREMLVDAGAGALDPALTYNLIYEFCPFPVLANAPACYRQAWVELATDDRLADVLADVLPPIFALVDYQAAYKESSASYRTGDSAWGMRQDGEPTAWTTAMRRINGDLNHG